MLRRNATTWLKRLAVTMTAGTIAACATRAKDAAVAGDGPNAKPNVPLVTGDSITPTTGPVQNVGSLPVNMIPVLGGRFVVTTDAGYRQHLWTIRAEDGKGVSELGFANRPAALAGKNGLYFGLAATPEGTLYAAQGNNDTIAVLSINNDGELAHKGSIATKKGDFPSGLSLDKNGRLYVANNDPQAPGTAIPCSVAIYDTAAGKEIGRYVFTDSYGGTPNFPLALVALTDGSKLYVGSERDGAVYVLDTRDPAKIKLVETLKTGSHPVALLMDKAQKRLFVANAHSDTVSVVDTSTDKITGTILMRPPVARDLAGATPIGLALSPNEKWLYVTLADMNAVGVIDVPDMELESYIPVGWYPTGIAVTPDGKKLMVANAKGTTERNPNPPGGKGRQQSPLNLLEGNVSTIQIPAKADFQKNTDQVLENNRLLPKYMNAGAAVKAVGIDAGKIKHVIYIVKENRTFDQVLGDIPGTNADPKYTIFGRDITPNQHALAERFILLDNFYDCGEVSGDGWTWSTQAMANEYVIRNVPYGYSSRGRQFDYEGMVNEFPTGGFPAKGPDGKPLSDHYKEGAKPVPDVALAPGGHLWDLARKKGLTIRNYGFFVGGGVKNKAGVVIPDNWPASEGLQPGGHDLEGITNLDFRRFDMDYADSDAPHLVAEKTKNPNALYNRAKFGKADSPSRFSEWNREFQMMLKKDPTGGAVPNLMTVRFCTDHTAGVNPDKHSPRSMVADNDYAVGQLVEAVSKSPIWKETAIFIIEDDAQNGPDHVDAHRSTCYVISPWQKKGTIDHTFHNTASCLRTIELLLGLPPMTQYDGVAEPIGNWDTAPKNDAPYTAIMADEKIYAERNGKGGTTKPISPEVRGPDAEEKVDPRWAVLVKESMAMDFQNADAAPADALNRIIWKSVRGLDSELPPTPTGPKSKILRQAAEKKDDDDD